MEQGEGIIQTFWEIALKAFIFDEHDAPKWVKRWVCDDNDPYNYDKGHFEMLFVNHAYTKEFGKTQDAYEGRQDAEVWGDTTGEKFNNADREALKNGQAIEHFQGNSFLKYRRNYIDGTILIIGRKLWRDN